MPAPVPPVVLPAGPRTQRFLFISKYGLIHDLAWEVKKEGQDVRYHIVLKSERDVADGFVEKVDKWEECKDWADVIVFDDCEFGPQADKLRAEGKAVIGGTPYTDRLEMDRDFGQEEMKAAGITTLPRWEFDSFDAAIAFIKTNPGRYVVKPSGRAQNEKVLSFVGQEEDGLDVLTMLEHYKNGWSTKIKS
ncbi:MAG TPA: phosphoribosylamine--glycine ligase, partial [Spirochaetia bacterium]|nr:phosphoribosylamine--glycine ligase [Spirochaetia bacterium]